MAFAALQQPTSNQYIEIPDSPPDYIPALAFSPTSTFLAAPSWDGNVRVYNVDTVNGAAVPVTMFQPHGPDQPVLDVCWTNDGSQIISAGADGSVQCYAANTQQTLKIGFHDAPVRNVRFVDAQGGLVASGSWDKTLKYWDLRQPTPIATANLPERCYTMDVKFPLLVVGTADRHICEFDLRSNPSIPKNTFTSPLRFQTRSVACMPSGDGYALGSVEGRLAVQYVPERPPKSNYTFRCHRENGIINNVNTITFHSKPGVVVTGGGDSLCFWDLGNKNKLNKYENLGGTVACSSFSNDGSVLAYAISYDWNRGQSGEGSMPNKIRLHKVQKEDLEKDNNANNNRR